eukprot:scaffold9330_cov117-Isochrysis_galbana.AAC.12
MQPDPVRLSFPEGYFQLWAADCTRTGRCRDLPPTCASRMRSRADRLQPGTVGLSPTQPSIHTTHEMIPICGAARDTAFPATGC